MNRKYSCKQILATVQVFLLITASVQSARQRRYDLVAENHRSSSCILRSTNVTSVTSCAVICSNTDACNGFSVGPAADGGFRTCEAVGLTPTANLTRTPLWRVFAGKDLFINTNATAFKALIHYSRANLGIIWRTKCKRDYALPKRGSLFWYSTISEKYVWAAGTHTCCKLKVLLCVLCFV